MRAETDEHVRQRREILKLVDASGLSSHRELIEARIKPAIGLRTRAPGDAAPIGVTKVGGEPDLPRGFTWPAGGDLPLLFVMQVDLEVVAPFDLEERLPTDGLLTVFSDRYNDFVTVFHHPKGVRLARHPWVPTENGPFAECLVDVLAELQVPPTQSELGEFDEPGFDSDAYDDGVARPWRDLQRPGNAGEAGIHQMLGYALGDTEHRRGEEVLIGFDSDDRAKMEWGDVHCVWVLMREKALAERAWGDLRVML